MNSQHPTLDTFQSPLLARKQPCVPLLTRGAGTQLTKAVTKSIRISRTPALWCCSPVITELSIHPVMLEKPVSPSILNSRAFQHGACLLDLRCLRGAGEIQADMMKNDPTCLVTSCPPPHQVGLDIGVCGGLYIKCTDICPSRVRCHG